MSRVEQSRCFTGASLAPKEQAGCSHETDDVVIGAASCFTRGPSGRIGQRLAFARLSASHEERGGPTLAVAHQGAEARRWFAGSLSGPRCRAIVVHEVQSDSCPLAGSLTASRPWRWADRHGDPAKVIRQEWGAAQWHGHFSRARTRIRVLPKVGTNGVREPVRVTRFGSALGFRVFLNPPADAWNCWTNQRRRDCLSLVAVLAQVLRAAEDEVDSASCLPTSR
jgi:hypothetical protein